MSELHSKLYRIQPDNVSKASTQHSFHKYLTVSLDSVWDLTFSGMESIVEQTLAASTWSASRICILQPDSNIEADSVRIHQCNRTINDVEIQRREIRHRLTAPFANNKWEIVIPTMRSELLHMNHMAKVSADICDRFRRDLSVIINSWISEPIKKDKTTHSAVVSSETNLEIAKSTSITVATDSLDDFSESSASEDGKEDSLDDIQIMPLQLDKNISLATTTVENDSQLLSYFYSSPLNVVRVVSQSLMVEAKNLITAKYDKLTHEVEMRKYKAVWQIQRLKSIPKTRQHLIQLREQDMQAWSLELTHRRRIAAPAQFLDAPVFESDDENVELANESTLIEMIPSINEDSIVTLLPEVASSIVENCSTLQPSMTAIVTDTAQAQINGGDVASTASQLKEDISQPLLSQSPAANDIPPPISTESIASLARESEVSLAPSFSSIRISQSPGGHSNLSLANSSQQDPITKETLLKSDGVSDDNESKSEFVCEAEEVVVDIDTHFASVLKQKKLNPEFPADDLEAIADQLIHPNLEDLWDEMAIQDTLVSLPNSMLLLGVSLGIVDIESDLDDDSDVVDTLKHVRESELNLIPCSTMLSNSLGEAIKWQCRALNLAALYSVLAASDLLGHLDTIEALFLISPRSDFLVSLSSHVLNGFVKQYDLLDEGHSRRNASVGRFEEGLWSQYRLLDAVHNASTRNHVNVKNNKYITLASYSLESRCSDTISAMNPMDELFSIEGLHTLSLEYTTSWPIPAILTSEVLANVAKMTCRLLELSQLSELLRLIWIQLRIQQRHRSAKFAMRNV